MVRELIPHKGLIPKVILQKSQEKLDLANPVKRNLLTWTSRAASHAFSTGVA